MSDKPLQSTVRFAGFDCIDPGSEPALARARREPTRANSYWNPLGPAWGRGYLVMFAKDVKQLLEGGNGALSYGLEMSDGQSTIKIPKLWVNKAERLTPGDAESKTAAYLVEVVDKRYFAAKFSDTGVLRSRVRAWAAEYNDDEFAPDNPMGLPFLYNENSLGPVDDNLESQITLLWDQIGTLGTMPELPEWFLGSDEVISHRRVLENIKFDATSCWMALHSILERLGTSLRYDPIKDIFEWVDLTTEQDVQHDEIDKRGWTLSVHPLSNDATIFPETLRVYFPKHFSNYGQENDTGRGDGTDTQRNWIMEPYHTEDVLVSAVASKPHATIPGTVFPLVASVPAVYDYANALFNLQEPNSTEGVALARLWVRAREQGANRGAVQVIGLLNKAVTGSLVKSVRWSNYGAAGGGCVTELVNQIGVPSAPGEEAKDETYAPLDICRGTFPNYPRVSQLVQIYHYTVTDDVESMDPPAGTVVNHDVDGTNISLALHSGRVVRLDGVIWPRTYEKCWIHFEDDYPAATHAPNGEFYTGRLMGGAAAGDAEEWRPLYFVRRGPIAPHTVTIDDQLNAGATTTATIFGIEDVVVRDRYLTSGAHANASATVVVAFDDVAGEFVAISGPHTT